LKIKFVEIYFQQQNDRPTDTWIALANEITDKYLASYQDMNKNDRLLHETQAHRTVRGWIKAAIAEKNAVQTPVDSPKQARKELRNKNKF